LVTNEEVERYLKNLSNNTLFTELKESDKDKAIFSALELLKDYFPIKKITDRAVALQVLYALEGEEEEYAKLKRHGVKSYAVKGVSVTFDGSGISPDVIHLIEPTNKAKVGRLI